MKTYEIVTNEFGNTVKVTLQDGRILWLPNDPANSDYAEYLRYTEWVEAGNTPEDFWTQTDELTEPKEEI